MANASILTSDHASPIVSSLPSLENGAEDANPNSLNISGSLNLNNSVNIANNVPPQQNHLANINTNGVVLENSSRPPSNGAVNTSSDIIQGPSQDELIIKGRGRRSLPLHWSPIPIESPKKCMSSTPLPKGKGVIALRSSPRKRLQLNDSSEVDHRRKLLLKSSPLARNLAGRKSLPPMFNFPSAEESIQKLSQAQLVTVLNKVLEQHPEVRDDVEKTCKDMNKSVNLRSREPY